MNPFQSDNIWKKKARQARRSSIRSRRSRSGKSR